MTSKTSQSHRRLEDTNSDSASVGFLAALSKPLGVLGLIAVALAFGAITFLPLPEKAISYIHVTVPALVIAIELIMLGSMVTERKERARTLEKLKDAMISLDHFRVALGRANYLSQIELAILQAQRFVVFTSWSMKPSWANDDETDENSASGAQRRIVEAVRKRRDQGKYSHRGVVAQRTEALPGTIELVVYYGVDIRMAEVMTHSRARYVVRDGTFAILGVAEGAPDLLDQNKNRQSTMSFSLESKVVAEALLSNFEHLFHNSKSPWEFLNSQIAESLKQFPKLCREDILQLLQTDRLKDKGELAIDKIRKNCPLFDRLPLRCPLDLENVKST